MARGANCSKSTALRFAKRCFLSPGRGSVVRQECFGGWEVAVICQGGRRGFSQVGIPCLDAVRAQRRASCGGPAEIKAETVRGAQRRAENGRWARRGAPENGPRARGALQQLKWQSSGVAGARAEARAG